MNPLRVISLGAGVQSTTMTLMAVQGELERPDCAIFADTGWEPAAVYQHLAWLRTTLPFPVHVVSAGNLCHDLERRNSARSGRFINVPFYMRSPSGEDGIGRRQCTSHYKIEPIYKKMRELLGIAPRGHMPRACVETWVGISVDEIIRATPSKRKFEVKRFPLLEKRMSRGDCIEWLKRHGYSIPPKSACIGCPFHSNATWRDMRDNRPEEWVDAVAIDRIIRMPASERGQQFMHPSRKPLDEVDLSTAADHGQMDLFLHECEGMCGV